MEGRSESDRGEDEVYSATFGNEENIGLKLEMDGWRNQTCWQREDRLLTSKIGL